MHLHRSRHAEEGLQGRDLLELQQVRGPDAVHKAATRLACSVLHVERASGPGTHPQTQQKRTPYPLARIR